jgi:hypothetical protein
VDAVLLNLGYGLSLLALTAQDVLWLRAVLLPSQISFLAWGGATGIQSTVLWNVVFIAINLFHIVKILRERRPVTLPPELSDIYESSFTGMKPREFWLFWETGHNKSVTDTPLVRQDERPDELMYLVSGKAEVVQDGTPIATLEPGQFAAEMSFLSGKPASADVIARGEVELKLWNQRKLSSLDTVNPQLSLKLQRILSRDVTTKAQASARQTFPPPLP